MLKIRTLHAGHGSLNVLKGVSLHVAEGEIVTIIGGNGAGKSTLLSTIAGLIKPDEGEVLLGRDPIQGIATEKIVSQGCALVPEGRQIFYTLSVRENLLLGAHTLRGKIGKGTRSAEALKQDLEKINALFPILKERENQLAGTLSGGEQQMLAIGRALMSRPKLLMLDEPSMGLAPIVVKTIFKTIKALKEKGMTILLVEQNARSALAVSDRAYVLETGSIMLEGSASEMLNNHDVQRAYLGKEYSSIADTE
jgi:branched-chain amino acid transport system ATP-binding protein